MARSLFELQLSSWYRFASVDGARLLLDVVDVRRAHDLVCSFVLKRDGAIKARSDKVVVSIQTYLVVSAHVLAFLLIHVPERNFAVSTRQLMSIDYQISRDAVIADG